MRPSPLHVRRRAGHGTGCRGSRAAGEPPPPPPSLRPFLPSPQRCPRHHLLVPRCRPTRRAARRRWPGRHRHRWRPPPAHPHRRPRHCHPRRRLANAAADPPSRPAPLPPRRRCRPPGRLLPRHLPRRRPRDWPRRRQRHRPPHRPPRSWKCEASSSLKSYGSDITASTSSPVAACVRTRVPTTEAEASKASGSDARVCIPNAVGVVP